VGLNGALHFFVKVPVEVQVSGYLSKSLATDNSTQGAAIMGRSLVGISYGRKLADQVLRCLLRTQSTLANISLDFAVSQHFMYCYVWSLIL
jgi:hypothetical protein